MMDNENTPRARVVDRIIRSRGVTPQGEPIALPADAPEYEAYSVTPGFPQMAFTLGVYLRDSKGHISMHSHGVLFHDVKKPKWQQDEMGMEHISFIHSGEAYSLRGRHLYAMYQALLECTLQAALEYSEHVFPPMDPDATIIDRVKVTDVQEMMRRAQIDGAKH